MSNNNDYSDENIAENRETEDNRSGGIYFGSQAIVQGDVIGGNKYDIRFYALSSNPRGSRVSWGKFRQETKSNHEEPYKFLSYYDITDADIFYGREVVSDLLVAKILRHKLVLINGKSGSGKTSLINAGIIPRLAEQGYFTVVFRDYGYPTDIIKVGIENLENVNLDLKNCHTLPEVILKLRSDAKRPIAIFLDQFERFFINLELSQQSQFIQEFSECLNTFNAQEISLIISVRQDFYGNLGEFWKVSPEFNTESYQYYLEPLNRDEALDAIKKPLQLLYPNIVYDPDFLETQLLPHLIKKTGEKTSQQVEPVHLQIVCNRLFDEVRIRNQQKLLDGETLIIKESLYQELGGVQGILNGYVDSILDQFTSQEREEAKSILKQMVTGQGTRAFKSSIELTTQLTISKEEVEKILEKLDRGRLIESIPSERKYSLTHEYLVQKVNQWYDIRELELKKAKELFERSLTNWKLYKSLIPREQFKAIRKFKANLNLDSEGEKLYHRSSLVYNGVNCLIGLAFLGLFTITQDILFHRFYLIPREIGRVIIESTKGKLLNSDTKVFSIGKDGSKKQVNLGWGFHQNIKLPKGLYYVEMKYGKYIVKHPVRIDGYQNYTNPVVIKIPTHKLSSDLVKNMAFVPKGEFLIGNPQEETTQKQVVIDSFYIDKYEVTNAEYTKFLEEIAVNPKSYQTFYNGQPELKRDKQGHEPGGWKTRLYGKYSGTDKSPVITVDWYDAFAYCAWQGKRLPTVLEWEKAASGKDEVGKPKKYAYPWGNETDFTKANTIDKWKWIDLDERRVEDVGQYPAGAGFYGVFDLTGNAFEWVDSWYVEPLINTNLTATNSGYRQQALKGGSFGQEQFFFPVYQTIWYDAGHRDVQYGFRCAISKSGN
jgi:formylglycine-generating enzyme required for sulfatase activity/energy-coupling factor transporter ATP-binding protein EcfA2